jgi:hypothetical protein
MVLWSSQGVVVDLGVLRLTLCNHGDFPLKLISHDFAAQIGQGNAATESIHSV